MIQTTNKLYWESEQRTLSTEQLDDYVTKGFTVLKRSNRIVNHLIQSETSIRVSRIISFRAGLQSAFRESFDSERDIKARFAIISFRAGLQSAFRDHFIQSGTSKRVSRSFHSERDFKARFAIISFRAGLQSAFQKNHFIQSRTSKRVLRSFHSERDFKSRFANHFIQSGTSKRI